MRDRLGFELAGDSRWLGREDLDEITAALKAGDKVQLIPFGSFVVRERKARTGRNPQTGETLKIAARKVPAFSSGKGLKDSVGGSQACRRRFQEIRLQGRRQEALIPLVSG